MVAPRARAIVEPMSDDAIAPASMPRPTRLLDGAWIPLGLVALGAIPALGGLTRLASFARASTLPDEARFADHPGALALHVTSALTFSLLGALQLWPGLRSHRPSVHRGLGRALIPAGLFAAVSGLWTMLAYAPAPTAGPTLHVLRVASALALLSFLLLGLRALRQKDYLQHGAWMTRAYALGIAPGVQALFLAPLAFGLGVDTELSFTTGMALGWALSLGVAEWSLRRTDTRHASREAVSSMSAIVYDRYGGPEELRLARTARPVPGPGQVRVRIEASSVNALDRRMLRADPFLARFASGLLEPRLRVLGADVAGVIDAVGPGVSDRVVGERVFGDTSNDGLGGFGEQVVLSERAVAPLPEGLDVLEAAALPLVVGTALQAVRDRARVTPGQHVLVWGAGGGVGTALVQIAKADGAHVTAVCGPSSMELVRSLGADEVLDRTHPMALEPSSFDVFFAVNGNRPLARSLELLRPRGVYVMVGGESRQIFEALILGPLHAWRSGRRVEALTTDPSRMAQNLEEIRALVARRALRPVIERVMPMSEAADAIRVLEAGHVRGKIVLDARGLASSSSSSETTTTGVGTALGRGLPREP